MIPTSFAYHQATSVADAVQILAENPDAKILAGGYSLIPAMKLRLAQPGVLVDLGKLDDLRGISRQADGVHIGAMATYDAIRDDPTIQELFPVLPSAIGYVGDQQVRAHGTWGGSLAHADPAADLTAVFLALEGTVHVVGAAGERDIAADDLFIDLWTTSLEPDEIITDLVLPIPAAGSVAGYKKYGHPASGYALVGVAVRLDLDGETVTNARVAITGATSKATRSAAAEAALTGAALTDEAIAAAASVITDGIEINGDAFASEEYRAHIAGVLLKQVIAAARG
ncbi:MAG TPA: xanthine dehydrogenase family protein subunit M [Thermomicrobiales bacterium]|nr:xanthine dehydrogenase family protein subunit M [Thermomicrobiales bacterium]